MTEAKTGRPKRREIDRLRTIVWIHAVMRAGGYSSGYQLETALEPDEDQGDGVFRPKKWDKYLTGKAVPQQIKGKGYAVEIAERQHPGTARFFNSPIWPILAGAKPEAQQIDKDLQALGPEVADLLFHAQREPGLSRAPREFTQETAEALLAAGTFTSLEVAVLLYAKAEAIASHELLGLAFDLYLNLQPAAEALPMVAPVAADLFAAVDGRCKLWVYVNNQSRLNVVVFSQSLRSNEAPKAGVSRERKLGIIGETTPKTRINGGDDKSYFDT
jgi:hypothetical protein